MRFQNIILDLLRVLPKNLIQYLAGQPIVIDGNTLDPNIQIIAKLNSQQIQKELLEPEDYRKAAKKLDEIALKNISGVTIKDEEINGSTGIMRIRTYYKNSNKEDAPAILFFHQGGLVIMDTKTDDYFCSLLADRCNAKVISLDYRRCPEHNFPAGIEDAFALWDYVQSNSNLLKINPRNIALAGDSAGGMISSALAYDLSHQKVIQPAALCLIYPWVTTSIENQQSIDSCADMFPMSFETMQFFRNTVFPDGLNIDHPWANILYQEDLRSLPPTIVATAGFDPIRDQGNQFAKTLKDSGVRVIHHCFNHLPHSFLILGRISKAVQNANNIIVDELSKLLSEDV